MLMTVLSASALFALNPTPAVGPDTAQAEQPEPIAIADVAQIAETEFASADVDGNAALTEEEYVAIASEGSSSGAGGLAGDADMMADRVSGPISASAYLTARFEVISGDDAQLSLDEYETALSNDFVAADGDGNEVLEGDELDLFTALRRGETVM